MVERLAPRVGGAPATAGLVLPPLPPPNSKEASEGAPVLPVADFVSVVLEFWGALVVTVKRETLKRALLSRGIPEHCCFTCSIVIFSSFCAMTAYALQNVNRPKTNLFIRKFV